MNALLELHEAWLGRLQLEWRALNRERLSGALRIPIFRIGEGKRTLGSFEPMSRILSISEDHVLNASWAEVTATLAHEMAHQVVFELWKLLAEPPHGKRFKEALALLVDPAEDTSLTDAEEKILRKVQKLLSLAQSDNPHEAQSAMATANTLLLQHNLRLADTEPRGYTRRRIGGESGRISMAWKLIGAILSDFFFVECIWVSTYDARQNIEKRQLEIMGRPGNVEMGEYVHHFLHSSLLGLVRSRKRLRIKTGRDFQCGVILGFKESLEQKREINRERGLIWVSDPGLSRFFKDNYPRTASLQGRGVSRGQDLQAGKEEGRKLVLRRPLHERSSFDPVKSLDV